MRESRRPLSFNQVAVPSRRTSGGRFFLSPQLGGYEPDGPNRPNKPNRTGLNRQNKPDRPNEPNRAELISPISLIAK